MNSILNMIANSDLYVLLQALDAARQGVPAKTFLKKLSNKDPRLKDIDFNDLYGSAQKLAKERSLNIDDVQKGIDETFAPHLKQTGG